MAKRAKKVERAKIVGVEEVGGVNWLGGQFVLFSFIFGCFIVSG
jgi:hypothetical protein